MDGASTEVFRKSAIDRVQAAKVKRLKEKLKAKLQEAAQIEVELSRTEKAIQGVPHYSVIEHRAHQLGRALSRQVQQQQMKELAATAPLTAKCPRCGKSRELTTRCRTLTTVDGQAAVPEVVGFCCRKFFFLNGKRWDVTAGNFRQA